MKFHSLRKILRHPAAALMLAWVPAAASGGEHWAWQPLRTEFPELSQNSSANSSHPIDSFVDAALKTAGLTPLPEADARTLVRRLSYDLHGLPPSVEDVESFVAAMAARGSGQAADPFAALVEKLLASPRYGERWARHWLDIAHYADTHGFERDKIRDHAWRYRDWVIRQFNEDLPYDEFLRRQIAGDVLYPDQADAIVATGFLAAGPWDFVGQAETPSPVIKRLARADDLDDMVTQVMTAACGVTINCARCHDHKLDPISQKEYFALAAVFAGVQRGDREISPAGKGGKQELEKQLALAKADVEKVKPEGVDLADVVGGGSGRGTGKKGAGLHPATGKPQIPHLQYVREKTNQYAIVEHPIIDGVVIPHGGPGKSVPISSTGIVIGYLPVTSGDAWDAIRNGPVNSQKSTTIGDTDYHAAGHSLLGLHANGAITFDLQPVRLDLKSTALSFHAHIGYGGGQPGDEAAAEVRIMVDGVVKFFAERLHSKSGRIFVGLPLPESARFLTLMATEGTGGISHDQVFFGDPRLVPTLSGADPQQQARIKAAQERIREIQKKIAALPPAEKVYAAVPGAPQQVRIQKRGNPEDPGDAVAPAALSCLKMMPASLTSMDATDGERRKALAQWITSLDNPLTTRTMANRLWHHHFGIGLVETPSDLGLGGGKPSHPALLDYLAGELVRQKWSLKALHRLICTSAAYRRASVGANAGAMAKDSGNRLLWRGPSRRVDAESLRDAVLAVSGRLNLEMYGPGWRDFDYKEEYAPVYTYKPALTPETWRRSIYRFVVRTTPHQFLSTLDCPNPANLTPSRNITTTALQSLALLNNAFMLDQSRHFGDRIRATAAAAEAQAATAFRLAFARSPSPSEAAAAAKLIRDAGLPELCRMLFNANEFVVID